MKCRKCNHVYDDSLTACPLCGEPAPADGQEKSPAGPAAPDVSQPSETDRPQTGAYSAGTGSDAESAYSRTERQRSTGYGSYTSQESGYQSSPAAYPPAAANAEPVAENAGVTPLILGILGLLIPFVGIVLGIIAIVMGNNQRKAFRPGTAHYGFGQAGWVLGIVAVVMQALLIIYFITVFSLVFSLVQDAVRTGISGYGSYSYPYFDF